MGAFDVENSINTTYRVTIEDDGRSIVITFSNREAAYMLCRAIAGASEFTTTLEQVIGNPFGYFKNLGSFLLTRDGSRYIPFVLPLMTIEEMIKFKAQSYYKLHGTKTLISVE